MIKKIRPLVRLRAHLLRDVLSRFWPILAQMCSVFPSGNFYGNLLKLSELQQLEVGIRVEPNFPIVILSLLTGLCLCHA